MTKKQELIELLERLEDYMSNKADAIDTDSGIAPNREMSLLAEIENMIDTLQDWNDGTWPTETVEPKSDLFKDMCRVAYAGYVPKDQLDKMLNS